MKTIRRRCLMIASSLHTILQRINPENHSELTDAAKRVGKKCDKVQANQRLLLAACNTWPLQRSVAGGMREDFDQTFAALFEASGHREASIYDSKHPQRVAWDWISGMPPTCATNI